MVNLADLITADDCLEVVRSSLGEGFRVNNYRLEKVKGQPGFLGEYAHLIVTTVQLVSTTRNLFQNLIKL